MPGLDERVMPPSSPGISSQTPGISSQTPGSSGGGQLKPPGPGGPSPVFGSSSKVILPIPAEPVSFGGDVTHRSSSSDIAYSQHAHVSFGGSSFTSTPFSTNTSAAAPVLGNSFGTTTADDDALKIAASNKLNPEAVAFTPGMFSSGLDNPKPAADDNPFLQNASFSFSGGPTSLDTFGSTTTNTSFGSSSTTDGVAFGHTPQFGGSFSWNDASVGNGDELINNDDDKKDDAINKESDV
jgi:hypothetical protein